LCQFPGATLLAVETYLGYTEIGKSWALAVEDRIVYYGPGRYKRPMEVLGYYGYAPRSLLAEPIYFRIEALSRLPQLLTSITEKAEATSKAMEKAKQLAASL
jgi:hypothetical protein